MSEFDAPPSGGDTPATPSPATPGPAAPTAPQQVTPAQATPSAPQEDRSNWIPPYRYKEAQEAATRRAYQEFAHREAAIRAEADRYRTQLHSLVGVTPQNQNPEADAIKNQFFQIFPEAQELLANAKELLALKENAGNMQYLEKQHWNSHGRNTVDRLFSKAQEVMGSPLTPEGKRFLHTSFVGYVQGSPELEERYASDPTIVDDFLHMFTSGIVDPSRRQVTAATMGRVPNGLPQDTPGGAPRMSPAPQPADLDERARMAWATYNAGRS